MTEPKMTLGEAIAISATGVLPPHADDDQRKLFDRLKPLGWEPYHTGGGCWGLRLVLRADVDALLTNGDLDFPTEAEWTAHIMSPQWDGDGLANWGRGTEWADPTDGVETLDAALALIDAFKASALPDALFKIVEDRTTAEAWIEALVEAGMDFHLDDDPADISWENGWTPSDVEVALLKYQVAALFAVKTWGRLEDPHGFSLLVAASKQPPADADTVAGEFQAAIRAGEMPEYKRFLPKGE
jgi:hypothetical protein